MNHKQRTALIAILIILVILAGMQTLQLVELRARIGSSSPAWRAIDQFFSGVRGTFITKEEPNAPGKTTAIPDSG